MSQGLKGYDSWNAEQRGGVGERRGCKSSQIFEPMLNVLHFILRATEGL